MQPNEILDNFSYERPSESVYKITGVRGSGKTVILAKVEDELRRNDWLVFDINPARDTLQQIVAMLSKEGFSEKKEKNVGFNISARQGYISLTLPFFADYIKEYCI